MHDIVKFILVSTCSNVRFLIRHPNIYVLLMNSDHSYIYCACNPLYYYMFLYAFLVEFVKSITNLNLPFCTFSRLLPIAYDRTRLHCKHIGAK